MHLSDAINSGSEQRYSAQEHQCLSLGRQDEGSVLLLDESARGIGEKQALAHLLFVPPLPGRLHRFCVAI